MISEQEKENLIADFLSDTLSDSDEKKIQQLYLNNQSFATQVDECVTIYTELFQWQNQNTIGNIAINNSTLSHKNEKPKQHFIPILKYSAASVILLLISLAFFKFNNRNISEKILTKIDTIYLPKKEYFSVHNDILAKAYIANVDMDNLVRKTSRTSRNNEICIPTNNFDYKNDIPIEFNLLKFRPGKYTIEVLGFIDYTIGVDTVLTTTRLINEKDKFIANWTPIVPGTYYWTIYNANAKEPILVRKFNVD